jgi:hypothetical protein
MNAISKRLTGTRKRIAARYSALDEEQQAVLLARLADRLSVTARETYEPGQGVSDGARLRAFNEALNRILAQLVQVLTANPRRYPNDVFANMLVDQFQTLRVDPEQLFAACLGSLSAPAQETASVATDR